MFEEPSAAGGTVRFGETSPEIIETSADENADDPARPQNNTEETTAEIITDPPEETTSEISENIQDDLTGEELFVVTPSGRRYHIEGCRHAQNIKEHLTREEAEAKNYTPCGTCKP